VERKTEEEPGRKDILSTICSGDEYTRESFLSFPTCAHRISPSIPHDTTLD
jgi:hypothetical protein